MVKAEAQVKSSRSSSSGSATVCRCLPHDDSRTSPGNLDKTAASKVVLFWRTNSEMKDKQGSSGWWPGGSVDAYAAANRCSRKLKYGDVVSGKRPNYHNHGPAITKDTNGHDLRDEGYQVIERPFGKTVDEILKYSIHETCVGPTPFFIQARQVRPYGDHSPEYDHILRPS
ncbi:hypothetical protein B0H17DRAFT_1142219 [Mycena rosella]|uniref:Uncharacterized protein n=1 Tax=Mycena rosella TaxID=1033263 RepID=A0AAD7CY65_MYCRO|nr:hypothetical protein B0H17DRAFT_1142219 [Mycena rosella]